ncbi:hypothetical protein GN244_ATG14371 [Phytophthora infestans]|uniref:Transmembrane protein n=1 Tax=Phytophthora infestans TaxID=4787 RepID=A0A833W8G5_PHYIN|nr:hypothetical protein GN244_ATG14371 [Phytophthora infestans]
MTHLGTISTGPRMTRGMIHPITPDQVAEKASRHFSSGREMFEALSRRFLRWQLEVAKGGRRGLVCGIFAVLVLVSTALWVLSRRDSAVTSVLHPSTPFQALLNANVKFATTVTKNINVVESEDIFPQYGDNSLPGRHFRLENAKLLSQSSNKNVDSVLVMVVLKDAESWGQGRGAQDFMELLGSFDYPKEKMSVTVLTSSASEFGVMKITLKIKLNGIPDSRCCFETISHSRMS